MRAGAHQQSNIAQGLDARPLSELAVVRGAERVAARAGNEERGASLPRRREWDQPAPTSSQITSFAGTISHPLARKSGRAFPLGLAAHPHLQVARRDARPAIGQAYQASVIAKTARGLSVSAGGHSGAHGPADPIIHHQSPPEVANCDGGNMRQDAAAVAFDQNPEMNRHAA